MLDDLKNSATAINLTMAFIGALTSNSYLSPATRKAAFSNVCVGMTFGAITAPLVSAILQWKMSGFPATLMVVGAMSFLLGTFAVIMIRAIVVVIKVAPAIIEKRAGKDA